VTLETIYYFSQILAVLGVIGSLIFVGMQMRQANVFARNEVTDRIGKGFSEIQQGIMTDGELSGVFQRAYAGHADFSEEEWTRLASYILVLISQTGSMLSAKRSGLLEPMTEEGGLRSVCWMLSKPAFAQAWKWQQRLDAHDPAIFDYVGAEFDKRYPELVGALRIDGKTKSAAAGADPKTEEEPDA
jgi:hypothetical protein